MENYSLEMCTHYLTPIISQLIQMRALPTLKMLGEFLANASLG